MYWLMLPLANICVFERLLCVNNHLHVSPPGYRNDLCLSEMSVQDTVKYKYRVERIAYATCMIVLNILAYLNIKSSEHITKIIPKSIEYPRICTYSYYIFEWHVCHSCGGPVDSITICAYEIASVERFTTHIDVIIIHGTNYMPTCSAYMLFYTHCANIFPGILVTHTRTRTHACYSLGLPLLAQPFAMRCAFACTYAFARTNVR